MGGARRRRGHRHDLRNFQRVQHRPEKGLERRELRVAHILKEARPAFRDDDTLVSSLELRIASRAAIVSGSVMIMLVLHPAFHSATADRRPGHKSAWPCPLANHWPLRSSFRGD